MDENFFLVQGGDLFGEIFIKLVDGNRTILGICYFQGKEAKASKQVQNYF